MQYFETRLGGENKIKIYFSVISNTNFLNKFDFSFFSALPRLLKIPVNIEAIIIIKDIFKFIMGMALKKL